MTIGEALAQHYEAHGLPADGGESNAWFRVRVGPLSVRLPNPPARQRAVFFHDVNHVLTGYNTVFSDGEMVIAAFEIGCGCGRFGIAWFINLCMMAIGTLLRPRALFRAFVRGRRQLSIYHRAEDRTALRARTVDEMRALLGVDRDVARPAASDRVRFAAWVVAAWIVTLGAAAAPVGVVWGMVAIARAVVA